MKIQFHGDAGNPKLKVLHSESAKERAKTMSITIYRRPVSSNSDHFNSGNLSEFETLQKLFGTKIGLTDVTRLRIMAKNSSSPINLFSEVADKIEAIGGNIEIWGEH